jgi:hypothetical protein
MGREYFLTFHRAIENARIYGDVLVFNLFSLDNPDLVAEMADFFMRMERVLTVFGMGNYQGEEVLSMRTGDHDHYAGKVIRNVVKGLGTAGGHGMIAGGQIRNVAQEVSVQSKLEAELTARLLGELEREHVKGLPVRDLK